jgi:hypothetical protein
VHQQFPSVAASGRRPDRLAAANRFHEIAAGRRGEFVERGLSARYFFAHRLHYLPRCGPDALKLGGRMCGVRAPEHHWEVLLHADPSLVADVPADLFFDDDIIWHRQHFGMPGHVAFAYLLVHRGAVYGLNYVSDLVQRISRRRHLKTRIEKVFEGWHYLLLNGIMNFAYEQGLAAVYSPTAALVMSQTDRTRRVQPELFERVYDRSIAHRWAATNHGHWWRIDVAENRDRVVVPATVSRTCTSPKTICISHDIERGLGHDGIDEERQRLADRISASALSDMLQSEHAAGVKTTYNVVGRILPDVRVPIEGGGHCLAFHSYSHSVRPFWPATRAYHRLRAALARRAGRANAADHYDQLYACRLIDARIRGFRPPQSRPSAEWSDFNLVFRNFDWLALSARRLAATAPVFRNRLVKIPVHFDDFPLYQGVPYEAWEREALTVIKRCDFVVFGLHDCYADFWLSRYEQLLRRLADLGVLRTLDDVANRIILANAV